MNVLRAMTVVDKNNAVMLDVGGDSIGPKDGSGRYANFFETITMDLLAASVDNGIWVCQEGVWVLQYVSEYHAVVGGSGANFQITVSAGGTQAPSAGTAQLTATVDLTVTAPKMQHGTLIASPTQMVRGDVLCLDMSGTLTGLVGRLTCGVKRVG